MRRDDGRRWWKARMIWLTWMMRRADGRQGWAGSPEWWEEVVEGKDELAYLNDDKRWWKARMGCLTSLHTSPPGYTSTTVSLLKIQWSEIWARASFGFYSIYQISSWQINGKDDQKLQKLLWGIAWARTQDFFDPTTRPVGKKMLFSVRLINRKKNGRYLYRMYAQGRYISVPPRA